MGLEQKELSKLAHLGGKTAAISGIESGDKIPSLRQLAWLAQALHCKIGYLLGETPDP